MRDRDRRLEGLRRARSATGGRSARARRGGHQIWWTVEAEDEQSALSLLPHYVAQRTVAEEVREVPLP